MTQQEALTFMTRVQQEIPGKIETSLDRSRGNTSFVVRLTLKSKQMTLTAYSPDDWISIKQAWCWFLGLEPEEPGPPDQYLIDGLAMTVNCYKGYWYGRWTQDGKSKRKFLGREDPREKFPLFINGQEVTI